MRRARAIATTPHGALPPDLADASIVVMSEAHVRCQVLALDRRDFSVYRRNDRQVIDFVAPPRR